VDVQGPEVVAPWVKKYDVKFPVVVDTADVFGAAFGLKAIPVSFLVDELGIIRLQGGGPTKDFRTQIEEILREPVSGGHLPMRESAPAPSLGELQQRVARQPDNPALRLALAQTLEQARDYTAALAECKVAARLQPGNAMIPFTHGLVLLRQGRTNEALVKFTAARDLDSGNWRIRKQIWALQNPDRFYGSQGIDWEWQKKQLAREKP